MDQPLIMDTKLQVHLINNYDNLCRLCANQEDVNLNVSENVIPKLLAECTPVPINDGDLLPKKICADCFLTLQLVYIFKQKCKKSKNTLEKLIEQRSKLEELGVLLGKHAANTSADITNDLDPTASETETDTIVSDANTSPSITHIYKSELQKTKTPYACEICDNNFKNPWLLGKHLKRMHNAPGLKCEKCPILFHHPLHLAFHLEKNHPEDPDEVEEPSEWLCETCGAQFLDKILYKNHMDNHMHGPKPHACDECFKTFNTRQNLRWHIDAIHLKIRNYECSKCSFTFYAKQDFQRHYQRRHLKVKGEKRKRVRRVNGV